MDLLDDARWDAVAARAAAGDDVFVYAVRTTGVFCRPSCPARRPRRDNVEFFATAEAARSAGYRPCRRCSPGTARPATASLDAVVRACRLLEEAGPPTGLDALAACVGLSGRHLHRAFRRSVGLTPRQYGAAVRLSRARRLLDGSTSVTRAVYDAGYGSSRAFYEQARRRLGMAPAALAAGGGGEAVDYTVVPTDLGLLLVAATPVGLCAVRFGATDEALRAGLAAELPRASLRRADRELAELAAAVRVLAEGDPAPRQLPLDIRATAFQARVWEALRLIPPGQTRSYAEVAAAVGQPRAGRAVGRACAANPVALVVPCHRVIGADGALGGYRWGVAVKAELLARERARSGPGAAEPPAP